MVPLPRPSHENTHCAPNFSDQNLEQGSELVLRKEGGQETRKQKKGCETELRQPPKRIEADEGGDLQRGWRLQGQQHSAR